MVCSSNRTMVRQGAYPYCYSRGKKSKDKIGNCAYCFRADDETMMLCDGEHGHDVLLHWSCAGIPPQQPDEAVPQDFYLPDGSKITVSLVKTYCRGCRGRMGEMWAQLRQTEAASNRLWSHLLEAEGARLQQQKQAQKPAAAAVPSTPTRRHTRRSTRRTTRFHHQRAAIDPCIVDSGEPTDQSSVNEEFPDAQCQYGEDPPLAPGFLTPFDHSQSAAAQVAHVPVSPSSAKTARICRAWTKEEEDLVAHYVSITLNGEQDIYDTERWSFIEHGLARHGYRRTWTALRQCWSFRLRQLYGVDERTDAAKSSYPLDQRKIERSVLPTQGQTMDDVRHQWFHQSTVDQNLDPALQDEDVKVLSGQAPSL